MCGSSAVMIFHVFLCCGGIFVTSFLQTFILGVLRLPDVEVGQVAVTRNFDSVVDADEISQVSWKALYCSTMSITITMVGGKWEWEILTHRFGSQFCVTPSRVTCGMLDGFLESGNGKPGGKRLDGLRNIPFTVTEFRERTIELTSISFARFNLCLALVPLLSFYWWVRQVWRIASRKEATVHMAKVPKRLGDGQEVLSQHDIRTPWMFWWVRLDLVFMVHHVPPIKPSHFSLRTCENGPYFPRALLFASWQ